MKSWTRIVIVLLLAGISAIPGVNAENRHLHPGVCYPGADMTLKLRECRIVFSKRKQEIDPVARHIDIPRWEIDRPQTEDEQQ